MKIIAISNFDNEMVSDILIAENVHLDYGKQIVQCLNLKEDQDSRYFHILVSDEYKLHKFEP